MVTCERIEGLLSAYLEGELAAVERAEVETHLAQCAECAELAALMREGMAVTAAFPEVEPSADLIVRLYGIPETEAVKSVRKPFFRPVFDWLARPALQPVYAAFTALFIVLSFVLFHPEGRGIRKQIDLKLHQGIGTVEKLYADAGSLKGEIRAVSANVVKSFNTLGLLGGDEKKQ
jgi:predicted anti-sigma-YlaC factor YlaD